MYTVQFNADYDDTVGSRLYPCESRYTNVRLSSVTTTSPDNLISTISNGDITQFIAVLGYDYIVNVSNIEASGAYLPVASSLSFAQLKALGYIDQTAVYQGGPHIRCPNDIAWLLYSVMNKSPTDVVIHPNLPSPADQIGTAIVNLTPILIGNGEDSYYNLYFPDPPQGEQYTITFRPSPGNITYATRINGIHWRWDYNYPDDDYVRPLSLDGSSITQLNITFEATPIL